MRAFQVLLVFVTGLYLFSIAGLIWHSRSYGQRADASLRAKILEPYKRTPYGLYDKRTGDVYSADQVEQVLNRSVRRIATVRTWIYAAVGFAATVLYGATVLTLAIACRLSAGRTAGSVKPSPPIRTAENLRPRFSLAALLIATALLPPIGYYLFQILSSISYILGP